jgi:hypothetical protein
MPRRGDPPERSITLVGHFLAATRPAFRGGTAMAVWYDGPLRNVFEIPHVGARSRRQGRAVAGEDIGISGAPTRYAPPGVVSCAARSAEKSELSRSAGARPGQAAAEFTVVAAEQTGGCPGSAKSLTVEMN